MKSRKIILSLFGLIMLLASCSKKSDPQPASSLSNVSLSLASSTPPVTAPASLSTSQNTYAQETDFYIEFVNAISSYSTAFTPPSGATKSSAKIVGVNQNGRVASTQQDYLVYIWTDPNIGSVAYQVSETTDSYTFELFYKATGTAGWVRYLDASEKKDKSSGFFNVYDPTITTKGSLPIVEYTWTRGTNTFTFVVDDNSGETVTLNYNTQTKTGDIEINSSSVLFEKLTWDGQGHGTWVEYDVDGVTEIAKGEW